jgi:hypothetical protein
MRATRLAGNGVAAAIRVAFAIPAKSRAAVLHNRCPTASLRRVTPSIRRLQVSFSESRYYSYIDYASDH